MQRLLLPVMMAALLPPAWPQEVKAPAELEPTDANGYFQRAAKMQMNKQWDAAVADASRAIRLDRELVSAYGIRAGAYRALGRFSEAIADYSEVIRRTPESGSSFYLYHVRGSLYLKINKPELAAADAEVAIRLRPEQPKGYELRAEARSQMGDQAAADQDRAWAEQLEKQIGPQRIGGNVMAANLVQKVTPEYPDLARQARVQGTVRFSAVISKEGTIETLNLISGHPLLADAARTAVLQWRYKPTLLNGDAVRVATTIDVHFTLQE